MNKKGNITKSDILNFQQANKIAIELLKTGKKTDSKLGLYICLVLTTGLRYSDAIEIKHEHIKAGKYELREKKTNKSKTYNFSPSFIAIYAKYYQEGEGWLFLNNSKNDVLSLSYLNRKLKQIFTGCVDHVSSHSLRKSFGRNIFDNATDKTAALYMLSEIFNHSDTKTTKGYIGVTQEELQVVIDGNQLVF